MRRHWAEVAPPAHVSLAASIGFRPSRPAASDRVDDPDELARQLRALGLLG